MESMKRRCKKLIMALCVAAVMIGVMATPAQAAYNAELGEYASDIEMGGEYVFESVKFPGLVAAPDTRPDYTDWLTLSKFYAKSPYGAHQVWHITNYDERTGEREGFIQISNHIRYYGSGTVRLITDTDEGYFWMPDRYGDESQWFTYKKAYKDSSGRQVWRFYSAKTKYKFAAGGWGDFYLREVIETDPAQG